MTKLLRLYAVPATLVGLRIAGAMAAFLVSLLLARNMETAEMGRAMVLMSLSILLGSVASVGMEAGAVRFIAKYKQANQLAKARGFLRLNRRIVGLFGPALFLTMIAVVWMISAWTQSPLNAGLIAALVTAVATGFLVVGSAHAMAFGKVVASLAPSAFIRQAWLLGALALYISLIAPPTAVQVICLFLFANVFAVIVQSLWCRGMTASIAGDGHDMSGWGEWLRFGFSLAPALLFVQYARDLTLIFSAWGLEPEDVAVLGVVTALVAFVKFAVVAVNQSMTAKMAKLVVADQQAELRELITTSNHMKLWPVLLGFVFFLVFGDAILGLFGEPFQERSHLLLILMLEPLALAFFGPGGQYISMSGRQRALFPAALVAILFMMVAINLGAWGFGLTGAAFGVAVTWIAWSGFLAFYVHKQTGMDLSFISSLSASMKKKSK
jgi:O-antigen/teichoic acid export membrane protein